MSTDTISVSHAMKPGQSSVNFHRTENSTVAHDASFTRKALNALTRGAMNFLGVSSPREVGQVLAKPSVAA